MRAEDNTLDLNNLPDDFNRDSNRSDLEFGSSSTGGCSKKKKRSGKDECEKVYQCRFCSLKFCKSQALGGHMNRHRQERETEAMNKARQMVFGDNIAAAPQTHPHLGCQSVGGAYHQYQPSTDPQLPSFRSVYPSPPAGTARLYSTPTSAGATSLLQQPPQLYPSQSQSTRLVPGYHPQMAINDYYVGHVLSSGGGYGPAPESNYTCIGAPVGPAAVQDHYHHRFQDHGF